MEKYKAMLKSELAQAAGVSLPTFRRCHSLSSFILIVFSSLRQTWRKGTKNK